MDILYLLIPLSLVLVTVLIGVVVWAVHNGQFDDLTGPAYRILEEDDEQPPFPAKEGCAKPAGSDTLNAVDKGDFIPRSCG